MFRWLMNWWHAGQRATDIAILWPLCKKHAASLDLAKAAFATHAFKDRAWLVLPHDEIVKQIDELE